MIRDINSIKEGVIGTDICIVGSGAAGVMLALEFKDTPLNVVVLEGGGFVEDTRTHALYDLESTGLHVAKDSRRRVFGGTTVAWTGGWKPLDEVDFIERDWIPLSGWPVQKKDLEPFYNRAAQYVGGRTQKEFAALAREHARADLTKRGALEPTFLWTLARRDWDFGKKFRSTLEACASVRVLLDANVTALRADTAGSTIGQVDVQTLRGKKYSVRARRIILACGGIENARLLLSSNIGNAYDQVGRYYMDHPKGNAGTITASDYEPLTKAYGERKVGDCSLLVGLHLSAAYQKKHRVPNSYVQLRIAHIGQSLPYRVATKLLRIRRRTNEIHVRTFMEQIPTPLNRVRLSERRDIFGNPLARVDWSIGEADKGGVRRLHQTLQEELAGSGIGTLQSPILENAHGPWPISSDASHHMGTTRMGVDPRTSVVDANCRVHGMENVFIAGSSVFPTSGNSNPTATLMALAVRLADHLKATGV